MAIDKDRLKEDVSNILKGIGKFTPGGVIKSLVKGNEEQIQKAIRLILSGTAPGRAAEAVKFIVDRYKLPESVAERLVANEMTDANVPTDPSGSADNFIERGTGPDAGAEDTSVPPERKRFPDITREMLEELFKNRRRKRLPQVPNEPIEFPRPRPFDPNEPIEFPRPRPFDPNEPIELQFLNQGGRVLKQTGGITESRVLPPEFIEAAQRTFLTDLATQAGMPSVTTATAKQPGETDAQFAQRQAQAQQFGITRAGMAELAPTS
jgi:hypothetical protein